MMTTDVSVAATCYRTTHRQGVADVDMAAALGYAKGDASVVEHVDTSPPQTFAHPADPGSRGRTMIDLGLVYRILRFRYAQETGYCF